MPEGAERLELGNDQRDPGHKGCEVHGDGDIEQYSPGAGRATAPAVGMRSVREENSGVLYSE